MDHPALRLLRTGSAGAEPTCGYEIELEHQAPGQAWAGASVPGAEAGAAAGRRESATSADHAGVGRPGKGRGPGLDQAHAVFDRLDKSNSGRSPWPSFVHAAAAVRWLRAVCAAWLICPVPPLCAPAGAGVLTLTTPRAARALSPRLQGSSPRNRFKMRCRTCGWPRRAREVPLLPCIRFQRAANWGRTPRLTTC